MRQPNLLKRSYPMSRSGSPALVIFDFDGTLCDSLSAIVKILNSIHEKHRFRSIDDETYARLRGQSVPAVMRTLGIRPWRVPLIARETRSELAKILPELKCHPGIKELLIELKSQDVKLAVITSNTLDNVTRFLDMNGINVFDEIWVSKKLEMKHRQIRKLLKRTRTQPQNAVYVCDEIRDIEAAKRCGIHSIAISWGANTIEALKEPCPSVLAHSSEELRTAIREFRAMSGTSTSCTAAKNGEWLTCTRILARCSKTYSIGTMAAPPSVRKSITLAYLLMRAADFLEDHPELGSSEKISALRSLLEAIETKSGLPHALLKLANDRKCPQAEVIRSFNAILTSLPDVPLSHQVAIRRALREMIGGMIDFQDRYPDGLQIRSVDEYERYVHYVSGVIGELLTELWYLSLPGVSRKDYEELKPLARDFSIFVKAVNDFQDAFHDAANEGGVRIPRAFFERTGGNPDELALGKCSPENLKALADFRDYALKHLSGISQYIQLIPKSEIRCRFFLIVPVLIALESLESFHDQSRSAGSTGMKIELGQLRKLYLAFITAPQFIASNYFLRQYCEKFGVIHA
jgi:phosphoglycolate phosphatase